MPGIMLAGSPIPSQTLSIIQHHSAEDFLAAAGYILQQNERSSNIILASALNITTSEATLSFSGTNLSANMRSSSSSSTPYRADCFWLTVWSSTSSAKPQNLDVVLSCTSSILGKCPIFLWTPCSPSSLSLPWLTPRITELSKYLYNCVPAGRVYSVFGKTLMVKVFSRYWSELTGYPTEPEPFYAAYHTFCTPESLKTFDHSLPAGHSIRQATMDDLESASRLCKEFAANSVFFLLSEEGAKIEAEYIISRCQMWLYDVMGDTASICVTSRHSPKVSAITKVYTDSAWRRNGFAEHLVRFVTERLFLDGKEQVVLNVGYNNTAKRVYDRIGFIGLSGQDKPDSVEDVLELGFIGTERGYW